MNNHSLTSFLLLTFPEVQLTVSVCVCWGEGRSWKDSSIFLAKLIHSNKNREIPSQLFQWLARKTFPWNIATENKLYVPALLKECAGAFQSLPTRECCTLSVRIVRTGFGFACFLHWNYLKTLGSTPVLGVEVWRLRVTEKRKKTSHQGSGNWSKDEVGLQLCWCVVTSCSVLGIHVSVVRPDRSCVCTQWKKVGK